MNRLFPVVVLALSLAACKSGATDMVNAAASGDTSAVKAAATESAKAEATTQVQAQAQAAALPQLQKMTPSTDYPAKKCVVTDEDLGAGAVAYSFGGREVQFCCPGCAQTFMKNPTMYLAKLDAAR